MYGRVFAPFRLIGTPAAISSGHILLAPGRDCDRGPAVRKLVRASSWLRGLRHRSRALSGTSYCQRSGPPSCRAAPLLSSPPRRGGPPSCSWADHAPTPCQRIWEAVKFQGRPLDSWRCHITRRPHHPRADHRRNFAARSQLEAGEKEDHDTRHCRPVPADGRSGLPRISLAERRALAVFPSFDVGADSMARHGPKHVDRLVTLSFGGYDVRVGLRRSRHLSVDRAARELFVPG